MLLRYAEPSRFRFLSVRADNKDLVAVKALMDEKWKIPFIISIVILLVVSALTIGGKVFKVASAQPADIIRSE